MSLPFSVGTLIIGAGPTGLGAAYCLDNGGDSDWLMVDAAHGPGGMAVTIVDEQGFRWDLGGHIICSHFESFDLATARYRDWVFPRRGGWVRIGETWCPTPIQRNLGVLVQGERIASEIGALRKTGAEQVYDLESYYKSTFGSTLHNLFFAPFNSKQWAWPLSELSHTWTSLRSGSKAANVPAAKVNSALSVQATPEDTSIFPYPALGTGSLWQSIANSLPTERQLYSVAVTRIDLKHQQAILSTGHSVQFKCCISTLPLVSLVSLVSHEQPGLTSYSDQLLFNSTHIVGFGFSGPLPKILVGKTWIFSADYSVPFHRATVPTNFSQSLSGAGRWSIMFETSISKHRNISPDSLAERHLTELRRWGIHDSPISTWKRHIQLGYPIPFIGRDELLQSLLSKFEDYNVLSRGRFGGWRYESSNQDYAFVQGIEAVRFFRNGDQEGTYWLGRRCA